MKVPIFVSKFQLNKPHIKGKWSLVMGKYSSFIRLNGPFRRSFVIFSWKKKQAILASQRSFILKENNFLWKKVMICGQRIVVLNGQMSG